MARPPDCLAVRICSIEGCGAPHLARGWCDSHYSKWRRSGDPLGIRKPSESERFWAKVDCDGPIPEYAPHLGPCWLWTGAAYSQGYGHFVDAEGNHVRAHRWLWVKVIGPIPGGRVMDHLCRVPACVNPGHLEVVTPGENVRRGIAGAALRNRTHCPRGHPFDEENTYYQKKNRGRQCRACRRERLSKGRA